MEANESVSDVISALKNYMVDTPDLSSEDELEHHVHNDRFLKFSTLLNAWTELEKNLPCLFEARANNTETRFFTCPGPAFTHGNNCRSRFVQPCLIYLICTLI